VKWQSEPLLLQLLLLWSPVPSLLPQVPWIQIPQHCCKAVKQTDSQKEVEKQKIEEKNRCVNRRGKNGREKR
jgi:hypothetical protein